MKNIPMPLINTMRSLRVKFGYSQGEAAKLIGVSIRTLRAWEQNSERVPYQSVKRIEEVYKTSQDYIFLVMRSLLVNL